MNENIIRDNLCDEGFTFHIFDTIDSTNSYLRILCENGINEKTVVIANEQTHGRGRRGKKFFSPANCGIYMSLLIKPDFEVNSPAKITTSAAVAVCRALKKVLNLKAQIKWVNDVYIDNKKVCGILTESVSDALTLKKKAVILGIGVNIVKPKDDYPIEIRDIASSVINNDCCFVNLKEKLIAEIINEFFNVLDFKEKDIYNEYKGLLFIIGKNIKVIGLKCFNAKVIDLSEDYSLIVKKDNGEIVNLSSGEISIKIC